MGVNYSAVIAIGEEFYSKYDAIAFLRQHGILTEGDEEEIDTDEFSEWLYNNDRVGGECLDYYSGEYYYVGYEVSCASPEAFQRTFEEGMASWKKYFPDVEPDVIRTVKVY